MLGTYIEIGILVGLLVSSVVILQMSLLLSSIKNLSVANVGIPAIVTFSLTMIFWPLVLIRLLSDTKSITRASQKFTETVTNHKEK